MNMPRRFSVGLEIVLAKSGTTSCSTTASTLQHTASTVLTGASKAGICLLVLAYVGEPKQQHRECLPRKVLPWQVRSMLLPLSSFCSATGKKKVSARLPVYIANKRNEAIIVHIGHAEDDKELFFAKGIHDEILHILSQVCGVGNVQKVLLPGESVELCPPTGCTLAFKLSMWQGLQIEGPPVHSYSVSLGDVLTADDVEPPQMSFVEV